MNPPATPNVMVLDEASRPETLSARTPHGLGWSPLGTVRDPSGTPLFGWAFRTRNIQVLSSLPIVEPDGYTWTNPVDGPCRGCELESLNLLLFGVAQACPIHPGGVR